MNVGHGRQELADAARQQMATLAFHSAYAGGTNEPAIGLAERLSALAYPSINTFFFTSGGAEASETSFKTARFYWKARRQARQDQGHLAPPRVSRPDAGGHERDRPAGVLADVRAADARLPPYRRAGSLPVREPTRGVSLGVAAANTLEEAILREGADTVAAFIAEPVQGAGGVIVPPGLLRPHPGDLRRGTTCC